MDLPPSGVRGAIASSSSLSASYRSKFPALLKKLVGMNFVAPLFSLTYIMLRELSFTLDSLLSVKMSGDSQDDNDDSLSI